MKIDLQLMHDILYGDGQLVWDEATRKGIAECFAFLERFLSDKVIYGINCNIISSVPMQREPVNRSRTLLYARLCSRARARSRNAKAAFTLN